MAKSKEDQLVSCLRNETVVVRFVPHENAMVGNNPKHILSGGRAEGSIRKYTVPMLKNGQLRDPLTRAEKDYLEYIMGLEPNALSVFHKPGYWTNYQVSLQKYDNVLDLSIPMDYIKYKVLLLNDDYIAPDLKTLQDYPKATYEYVLIREEEEAKMSQKKVNNTVEAFIEYGKISENPSVLRLIYETMTGRPMADMSLIQLQDKVVSLIQNDSKVFLKTVNDPLLMTKVLLRDCVSAGIVVNRSGNLFLREDNLPLCNSGDSKLSVAAAYLNEPKNQELKLILEAKVKEFKKKD